MASGIEGRPESPSAEWIVEGNIIHNPEPGGIYLLGSSPRLFDPYEWFDPEVGRTRLIAVRERR